MLREDNNSRWTDAIWAKCALPRSTFLPLIDMWMPPSPLLYKTSRKMVLHPMP